MSFPFSTAAMPTSIDGPGVAEAQRAAALIRERAGDRWQTPVCAIVLGSGLGGLADRVDDAVRISFGDIPGFPQATVAGHAGNLLLGELEGQPVALLAGRLHLYEGHTPAMAGYPVRVMHALGAPIYMASNAAGGVGRALDPGDLMLLADHLNMMFRNPLHGPTQPGDERFPDMAAPYDAELRARMHQAANAEGVELKDGVYMGLLGPTYETPAEVRMAERFGADAVGMSTVPEVVVARALGMRAVAISLITNKATGMHGGTLSHDEVLAAASEASNRFESLVCRFVRDLGNQAQ